MNKLKVCFVGIGSIAKRHIVNLAKLCHEQNIELTIDALRTGKGVLPNEIKKYIAKIYYAYEDMPADYDIAFITNPTDLHIETLKKIHDKAQNFFIEKPIVSYKRLDEITLSNLSKEKVYYVACPLRYTKVIQYIKNQININQVISVRCICSSYLPDWRPEIDYRDTYSAHKNMGGGVAIDLIHEWDYLTYLFGFPNVVKSLVGKKSKLEIDSDDHALYIADYQDKIIELHLDYFGQFPIRRITLFTVDDTVECDLIASKIEYMKSKKTILFGEERNDFQIKELNHFLSMIGNKQYGTEEVEHAIKVLRLTQGVI